MTNRKGYSDGPQGQVHWRMSAPLEPVSQPDLYCFSPAPFGSIAYATMLPYLGRYQSAVAPDYPGQGQSEGGSPAPRIEDYAAAMIAVIRAMSDQIPVNLLGFHSGCLVAAEIALQAPDLIRHCVLIDVPAFDADTRSKYLPRVGAPFEPTAELSSVSKAWEMSVTKRLDTQPLDQCLAMFSDIVGNGPRMNATFHAAFTYDVEDKLAAMQSDTTVIATQSSLLEPSRRAAQLIPNCDLLERLDIQRSVLDAHAETTAQTVQSVLS